MYCSTSYSIGQLSDMMQAQCIGASKAQDTICTLLIDSRIVSHAAKAIFFAIRSSRKDGHDYIPDAYQKGVRAFVIDKEVDISSFPEAVFLKVEQVVGALQILATVHRQQMTMPILGITGSNGKTIIKEWIYQCLSHEQMISRSPKSYNSQIGVPLSLWQLQAQDDMAIIEAGISLPYEMSSLQRMIQPDIGLLTNIREAHLNAFKDRIALAKEKLKLFADVNTLVYSSNDKEIDALIRNTFDSDKLFSWGQEVKDKLQFVGSQKDKGYRLIQVRYKNEPFSFSIPFTDAASLENAMHVCAFLLQQGYNPAFVQERMPRLQKVEMRLEIKEALNQCTLINDAYSFDATSLHIALELLQQQEQYTKKTLIISDMPQLKADKDFCMSFNTQLQDIGVQKLIAIGEQWRPHAELFSMEAYFYKDTDAFLNSPQHHQFYNECILLKGARRFAFEHIAKALESKHHQTRLEVHLDRMLDNLHYFKQQLEPQTRIMLMVKAFAYGSGSQEIANFLQYHRADYLTVAYTDEGVRLRQAGIQTPIMVMNADHHNMAALIEHHLEPEVFSFDTLDAIEWLLPKDRPLPLHIKLDTGMHRLGFCKEDIPALISRLKAQPNWYIQSVFTHLATADMPEEDAFTLGQLALFEKGANQLQTAFPRQNILRHALNSVGILRFPQYQFDMVRLGLGLYGFSSEPAAKARLQQIHVLKTHISQIKQLKKGDNVGYARAYTCSADTLVATVPIGYADGIHRYLGNGRYSMRLRGVEVPILGNVCMDMCMLDISAVPNAKAGEEVVVFSKQSDVENMAQIGQTIPYEILTNISERVQRVYVRE